MMPATISRNFLGAGASLAAFCLLACSSEPAGSGEPPPPATVGTLSFEITAPGEGEPNEASLVRLSSGQLLFTPGVARAYRVVAGPVRFGDRELVEVWYGTGKATWEAVTEDGLVRFGDSEAGLYDQAVLTVPPTVRLGMEWTSGGSRFEVTNRSVTSTTWGELPVWQIEEFTSPDSLGCHRRYAEGFGLIRDRCDGAADDFSAGIELVEATPFEPDTPVTLEPVENAGTQAEVTIGARTVWGIDLVPGTRPLVMTVDGPPGYFDASDGPLARRCLDVTPERAVLERLPLPLFGKAGGIVPIGQLPLIQGPPTCPYGEFHKDVIENLFNRHALAAGMRADGSGGIWYGQTSPDGSFDQDPMNHVSLETPLVAVADFGGPEPTAVPWNTIGNFNLDFSRGMLTAGSNASPLMTIPGSLPVDDLLAVGFVGPSGQLFGSSVDATGAFSPFVPASFSGPFLTVRASPTVRDVLHAAPGGRIDRLVLEKDGWRRMPLVTVALPTGEAAVAGAFMTQGTMPGEERLLVLTRGRDEMVLPVGGGQVNDIRWEHTLFWTAPLPPNAASAPPWLSALSVTAEKLGADMRICWPPAAKPDPTGWEIGGAPAAGVVPHYEDEHCVAVFRSASAPSGPDAPSGTTAEGPVPGIGRVRVSLPPGAADPPFRFEGGGALKGGGFAGPASNCGAVVFGEGAVPLFPTVLFDPYVKTLPDIGGAGLWAVMKGDPGVDLYLVGKEGIKLLRKQVSPEITAVGGGGVVTFNYPDPGLLIVRPDGSEKVISSNDLVSLSHYVVFSDGTACGHRPSQQRVGWTQYRCVDPDGTVREAEWEVDSLNLPTKEYPMEWPLPSGHHVVVSDQGQQSTWLVDSKSMTFSVLTPGLLQMPTFDSSGRLFASLNGTWNEVTEDGLVALDLGGIAPGSSQVWVDEKYYVIGDTRVPR